MARTSPTAAMSRSSSKTAARRSSLSANTRSTHFPGASARSISSRPGRPRPTHGGSTGAGLSKARPSTSRSVSPGGPLPTPSAGLRVAFRFVVSKRLPSPPTVDPLRRLLASYPGTRLKLDPTSEWTAAVVEELSVLDAVDIVDLKAAYRGTAVDQPTDPALYARVAEGFPTAIIEDPDVDDPEARAVLEPYRDRISWDAIIHSVADVEALPFPPKTLNVKPSRFGSLSALFATYDYCERRSIQMYGGGQFELGPGRGQIQYLASLFHPDGPNDVAPKGYNAPEPAAGSRRARSPRQLRRPAFAGREVAEGTDPAYGVAARMYVHRRYDPNDRYRDRRRRARRGKRMRRAAIATALLAATAAVVLGATFFTRGGETEAAPAPGDTAVVKGRVPNEIRGVHVTMGLASIEGKLGRVFALRAYGLNTIELDVKDENGSVGFDSPALPRLARDVGSASTSYDARPSHAPRMRRTSTHRSRRHLRRSDTRGSAPRARAPVARRLRLARPGRARLAQRVRQASLGLRREHRGGRGEGRLRRDPVRLRPLPERRSDRIDRPRGSVREPRRTETIARFLRYASKRLHPLGVRVSADLFGLAATRDLGVGQSPKLRRPLSSTRSTRWSTRPTSCPVSTTSSSRRRSRSNRCERARGLSARRPREDGVRRPGWQDFSLRRGTAWQRWRIRCRRRARRTRTGPALEPARRVHAGGARLALTCVRLSSRRFLTTRSTRAHAGARYFGANAEIRLLACS